VVTGGNALFHELVGDIVASGSGASLYAISESVRIYADPGTNVSVSAAGQSVLLTVAGYLIDVP